MRHRKFGRENVVEITLAFMKERMQLENVTKDVRLKVPDGLKHRRYRRRIVISPDSASPGRKDWDPARFLALADRIAARGYDPRIVVAPANHQEWKTMPGNTYETPKFLSIAELAAFLYAGVRSSPRTRGNGHLASILRGPHDHDPPGVETQTGVPRHVFVLGHADDPPGNGSLKRPFALRWRRFCEELDPLLLPLVTVRPVSAGDWGYSESLSLLSPLVDDA